MLDLLNANPAFPASQSDVSFSAEVVAAGQYPRLIVIVTNGGVSQGSEIDGPQVDVLIADLAAWRAVNPDPTFPSSGQHTGSIA